MNIELNIALMPEPALADTLTSFSQKMAERYPAIVRLGQAGSRLTLAPHLTLLQTILPVEKLTEAAARTEQLCTQHPTLSMKATSYAFNAGEASLEVQKEVTDENVAIQTAVIDIFNPLRGNLLMERDPAGNELRTLLHAEGVLGENIRRYGYGEVGDPRQGGLYRPHDTVNWFELGTEINLDSEQLPALSTFDGRYDYMGIFALGPNGTCPQLLAKYVLAA